MNTPTTVVLKLDDEQFQTLRRDMVATICLHGMLTGTRRWQLKPGEDVSTHVEWAMAAGEISAAVLSEKKGNANQGKDGLNNSQGNANLSEAGHA